MFGVFHDAGYKGLYGGLGRDAIKRIGGTLPENIPPAEHIKDVEKRVKSATPKLELDDREAGSLLGEAVRKPGSRPRMMPPRRRKVTRAGEQWARRPTKTRRNELGLRSRMKRITGRSYHPSFAACSFLRGTCSRRPTGSPSPVPRSCQPWSPGRSKPRSSRTAPRKPASRSSRSA